MNDAGVGACSRPLCFWGGDRGALAEERAHRSESDGTQSNPDLRRGSGAAS